MNETRKPFRWIFRLESPGETVDSQSPNMRQIMSTYHPKGSPPLNTTEWRGKPARSCSIQRIAFGSETGHRLQIEVEYRPKDWVSYVGDTKYVGWTAYMLDQDSDGVLLDGNGNQLPDGEEPVLLPVELYDDLEFNNLDFGELIDEIPLFEDSDVAFEDIMRQIELSGHFKIGGADAVAVLHRSRPRVMILISDSPTGLMRGGFGELIQNINSETPHLRQVVSEQLVALVRGFLEGRYDISALQGADIFMLDLTKILVDATEKESRFECLLEFLPDGFLNELARRVSSRYKLQAKVVTGKSQGLLLEFEDNKTK